MRVLILYKGLIDLAVCKMVEIVGIQCLIKKSTMVKLRSQTYEVKVYQSLYLFSFVSVYQVSET